jgi:hypothetical protein
VPSNTTCILEFGDEGATCEGAARPAPCAHAPSASVTAMTAINRRIFVANRIISSSHKRPLRIAFRSAVHCRARLPRFGYHNVVQQQFGKDKPINGRGFFQFFQ